MIEGGFAPQVLSSSIKQLYKTGILKVDCLVFQFERFDVMTMQQVRSIEKSPTIDNVPSRSSEWFLLLYCFSVVTSV